VRFQCKFDVVPTVHSAPQRATAGPRRRARTAATRDPGSCPPRRLGLALVAGAALAVAGCASFDGQGRPVWKLEPVYRVNHVMQSALAYYGLGRYFDGSEQWDKSIDAYRKAIAADAGYVEAYNALGVALARSGRHADAEITLRQAVALAPAQAHILNNLGYVLLLGGKAHDAVTALQAAVALDGENEGAAANLRLALASDAGTPAPVATAQAQAAPAPSPTAAMDTPAGIATVASPSPGRLADGVSPAPAVEAPFVTAPAVTSPVVTGSVVTAPIVTAPPSSVAGATPAPGAAASGTATIPPMPISSVEVSNGNGTPRMAEKVGRWLATVHGVQVDRLTNQRPFTQAHTVIQYRHGHREEAQRLARRMPAAIEPGPHASAGLRSNLRIVLGRDLVSRASCFQANGCAADTTAVASARP